MYYIYNYDSIFSTPKTLMTLMTNDFNDLMTYKDITSEQEIT